MRVFHFWGSSLSEDKYTLIVFTFFSLYCKSSERSLKVEEITVAVVKVLMSSCGECSSVMIDNQFLVCYPESPAFLTYRARLEGTSETDSGSLISIMEEWVTGGGANVTVTGVLMTVDSHCSVAISSLSQLECSPPSNTEPRTNSTSTATTTTKSDVDRSGSDESYSTTIAIIAGVVAIFLLIFVAIVIIIILATKK